MAGSRTATPPKTKPPRAPRRLVLIIAGALAVVVVMALLLIPFILPGHVADRLAGTLGQRVEVGGVHLGGSATDLVNLRIYEPNLPTPWVSAERVTAHADLSELTVGNGKIDRLTLTNAQALLRFDRHNSLLTPLPTGNANRKFPSIQIDNGQVTLRQAGHDDCVVQGLTATGTPTPRGLSLEGTINDPFWGQWTALAAIDSLEGWKLVLTTPEPVDVTETRLRGVPFVPPTVWNEVLASGPSIVHVTVKGDTRGNVRYVVTAQPTDAHVRVNSIGVVADHAAGRVEVADNIVFLTDVRGQFAGGMLHTDANLNFAGQEPILRLRVDLKQVNLRELPELWGLHRLPGKPTGRLTGKADFTVRIPGTTVEVRGKGEGRVAGGTVAGFPATIDLNLQADERGLRFVPYQVERIAAPRPEPTEPLNVLPTLEPDEPPSGISFRGGANRLGLARWLAERVPTAAPAEPTFLDANLELKDVDVPELLRRLEVKVPVKLRGTATLRVLLRVPVENPNTPSAYRVSGTLTAPRFQIDDLVLENFSAKLRYADDLVTLEELTGRLPNDPGTVGPMPPALVTGSATVKTTGTYAFAGKLSITGLDLGAVERLSPAARPPIELAGRVALAGAVQGTFSPLAYTAQGTATTAGLLVDRFQLDHAFARWDVTPERVRLTDVKAGLYQGELTATAELPLLPKGTGTVDLNLKGLDVGALLATLPKISVPVKGQVDGPIKLTLPPADAQGERDVTATLDLKAAPKLIVQVGLGLPAQRVAGTAGFRDGKVNYDLNVDLPFGKLKVQFPTEKAGPMGRVSVEAGDLAALWPQLGLKASFGPLTGRVDGTLTYSPDTSVGTGRLEVTNLRWGQTAFTGRLRADILLNENEFRIHHLTGELAGGMVVGGQVAYRLKQPSRSYATLAIDRAPAERLLAPLPGWSDIVQGPLDVRVRTRIGPELIGGADLYATRATLLGAEVIDLRVPIDWDILPARGVARLNVRDAGGQVARGRLTGRAEINLSPTARLRGEVNFSEVELSEFVRYYSPTTQIGRGRVRGRIDLAADDLRSVNDLRGTLVAQLRDVQPFRLPVLQTALQYLTFDLAEEPYREGDARATLANGILRIQRLSMIGTRQLFVEGNVTLAGRLDLETTISTGPTGVLPVALTLLRPRLPIFGPVPVTLIRDVNRLLANRTLQLHIGGTLRTPTVRLNPLPLLTEEAVRFFLGRYEPVLLSQAGN